MNQLLSFIGDAYLDATDIHRWIRAEIAEALHGLADHIHPWDDR